MTKLATIERIQKLEPHGNADTLEVAKVLGYDAIVRIGEFREGDLVVFIQPDTNLPGDMEWCKEILKYCGSNGRVKAARLRGVWSMGIVMPIGILDDAAVEIAYEGMEVSELLGITKYEPPLPKDVSAKGGLPFGIPKTDEERWQNIRNIPWGEPVDVTLKVDGSSFTAYCVLPGHFPGVEDVQVGICSRSLELRDEPNFTNVWLEVARKYDILSKLQGMCTMLGFSMAIRGEVHGQGIQSGAKNPHAAGPVDLSIFGTYMINNPKGPIIRGDIGLDSAWYFTHVANALELKAVKVLEHRVPLTPELIKKYDSELKTIDGKPFEGVVMKFGDGRSLKVISKWYDAEK